MIARFSEPQAPAVEATVHSIPGDSELFLVRYDWIPEWSGDFACVHFSQGAVDWVAERSDPPMEQFIRSVRPIHFQGRPAFEVLGETHQGNGNLYLYLLEGRVLRCVLKTPAVDRGNDGVGFDSGLLTWSYRDLNGTALTDPEQGRPDIPIESSPIRRIYVWNPDSDGFIPVVSVSECDR